MDKFVIVVPHKSIASKNILDNLNELDVPKNAEVYITDKESINNEDVDKIVEGDYYIFATKHQSTSKKPSLCIHAPGNFSDNELGGKEKELNVAMPSFMKIGLKELEKRKLKGFEVDMEATHHGPFLNKGVLFIEIGSSEEEWGNPEAGRVVAKVILEIVRNKKKFKSCIVLGGGHYNQVAKKLMLNSDWGVGHVCPKHQLENLDGEMLKQMMQRNEPRAELVVLDWKGLGKEKQRIVGLLDKLNIEYKKYDEIK